MVHRTPCSGKRIAKCAAAPSAHRQVIILVVLSENSGRFRIPARDFRLCRTLKATLATSPRIEARTHDAHLACDRIRERNGMRVIPQRSASQWLSTRLKVDFVIVAREQSLRKSLLWFAWSPGREALSTATGARDRGSCRNRRCARSSSMGLLRGRCRSDSSARNREHRVIP